MDTREYVVELPDGTMAEYAANVIAENMYSQCDSEGQEYLLLREIVDHRKDAMAYTLDQGWVQTRSGRKIKAENNKRLAVISILEGWPACVAELTLSFMEVMVGKQCCMFMCYIPKCGNGPKYSIHICHQRCVPVWQAPKAFGSCTSPIVITRRAILSPFLDCIVNSVICQRHWHEIRAQRTSKSGVGAKFNLNTCSWCKVPAKQQLIKGGGFPKHALKIMA